MQDSKADTPQKELNLDMTIFEQIIQNSPGHIYWKDRDGAILGCNLKQAQTNGFKSVEEIVGKTDFDLLGNDDASKIRQNDLEVMNSGQNLVKEEVVNIQGKKCVFLSHKTPLRDVNGEITGTLGVSLDITEQTKLQDIANAQMTQHQEKTYVAYLSHLEQKEKDFLKSKSCVLCISVGQEYHEGEKFKATLKMISSYFKNCTIAIGDTLQRHTIHTTYDNKTSSELYDISKKLGDEWIERNGKMIEEELKIPYCYIRWDHWLNSTKFEEDFKKVKHRFATNEQYKTSVIEGINEFSTRYHKRNQNISLEKISQCSLEYIIEECACMLQWFDEGYDYFIYPSEKNKAVIATFALFEPERCDLLLRSAIVRYKSCTNKSDVNLSQITLDSIIETLPGHIYWKDKHGVILGCNRKQLQSLKLKDIKSVVGKSDFDLLDYNEALHLRQNDIEVMNSRKTCIKEESAVLLGKKSTFLTYKTPLISKNGVLGILGVSLDITKQKEAEAQLMERNQQLTEAIRAKQEFLQNISHEIRTPLSCILKMSNLLFEDWEKYPNNEARKAHLKMAVDGNNRLQSVLLNLLDMSKVNAGKMEYNKKSYSLKKSTQDVISEFIDQQYRIHLSCHSKSNDDLSGIYDHFRIEQVIRNLLANAVSYAKTGDINITLSSDDGFLIFDITDQGVGVPEDELEAIFKIFTQSSRTKTGAGGSGIGLSISKTIIEDHDGSISAQNNENGVGSCFSFKLPVSSNNTDKSEATMTSADISQKKPIAKKPTLLVIDDEEAILQVSELVFNRMGFNVILADSGTDGLETLQNSAEVIDVVLLDMMMVDMSGLDVLRVIKADPKLRDIPIYIYSGASHTEEVDGALALGALGCIDKTSSSEQISVLLSRFLRKYTHIS